MKIESLVSAIGAPILVGFVLFRFLPGTSSQTALSSSAIMILVNLTTLKATASVPLQEKQTFLDALDRFMIRRGWWRKTTKSDEFLYRAPMPLSLFISDLDVDFSAANTANISGPQWLVRALCRKLNTI